MRTTILLFVIAAAACGGKTPLPKGPAPEYEEEVSEAGASGAEAAPVPVDAGSQSNDAGASAL